MVIETKIRFESCGVVITQKIDGATTLKGTQGPGNIDLDAQVPSGPVPPGVSLTRPPESQATARTLGGAALTPGAPGRKDIGAGDYGQTDTGGGGMGIGGVTVVFGSLLSHCSFPSNPTASEAKKAAEPKSQSQEGDKKA